LFCEARLMFRDASIYLGCMRPAGAYRRALDRLAVECGLDGIVMPAPGAARAASRHGLRIITSEECCAFGTASA